MPRKTSKALTLAQFQALAEFRYQLRRFIRFSEEAARKSGITGQQHQALLAIQGYPGRQRVSVGELAERLQLKHHSVVGLLKRLVHKKWVRKVECQADHRQVLVELTPQGARLLARLSSVHQSQLQVVGPRIVDQLKTLHSSGA